jgi:putative ABC transport system substrate-binding protein
MGLLMPRRAPGVVALAALLLAVPPADLRPQAAEAVRVGVLVSGPAALADELVAGFREAYAQKGIAVEVAVVRLGDNALVVWERPVDLVLALGASAVRAVEAGDPRVPVVASLVVRSADLPRMPRATGVYLEIPLAVEFQWLQRLLPGRRRVGLLYSAENDAVVARARESTRAAGLELVARRVAQPADLPEALAEVLRDADVLWGIADGTVLTTESARAIMLAALRSRVPFVGLSRPWVKAGAVYALDRDYRDIGRQCADLALALRAESTVPRPEAPRRVVYAVNGRAADQLRITFPDSLLRNAVEVVR